MLTEMMIDGVAPDRVERPATPEELAQTVGEANASGTWLLPVGGGTALRAATPVETVPIALDLTALRGTRDYEPADLTVSVLAGTPWRELQETLAREGQTVPLDVPFPDRATVGGVVATGYAGPRRLRDGTMKDLLIGASYVRGDGLLAKAGGMVVKNVSGFEIPRLLHGSWGALAVIASVNLKVVPLHPWDVTLHTAPLPTEEAVARALGLTVRRSAIAAALVHGTLAEAAVAVRVTGSEAPTEDLAREIEADAELAFDDRSREPEGSSRWWQDMVEAAAGEGDTQVGIEVGCTPTAVPEVMAALRRAVPDPAGVTVQVAPGVGAIALAFPADMLTLSAWRRLWAEHGLGEHARWVVTAAPRAWRAEGDLWDIPEGPLRVMHALKRQFDPNDALNRGRLWAAPATSDR